MSNERETPFSSAPPGRVFDRPGAPPSSLTDGVIHTVYGDSEQGSGSSSGEGDRRCAVPGGEGERGSAPPVVEPQRATLPAMAPTYPLSSPRAFTTALATSETPTVVTFGSGRAITAMEKDGEERVEIRSSSGALLISMRLTDEGPVFSVSGASFEISAAKTMSLKAETLRLSATHDVTIEAGGALVERVAGDATREVGGLDRVSARDVEVAAKPGGISLRANDDVDIVGERVRLNSDDPPMPLTWEEHRARHALPVNEVSQEQPANQPVIEAEGVEAEAGE